MSCYDIVYDLIVKAECCLTVRIRAKKSSRKPKAKVLYFWKTVRYFPQTLAKYQKYMLQYYNYIRIYKDED